MRVAVYLATATGLLLAGYFVLRVYYRRVYREHGSLTPFAAFLGTAVWFSLGGFPAIYLPGDWPTVQLSPLAEIIGWLLLAGGLLLIFAGMASLGLLTAFGRGRNELMLRGLYRFSRNPQIIGCAFYCLGFFALWPSWYAVGWLLIFALLAHSMIITEEEHLNRTFGREYVDYCGRVPRYLRLAFPVSRHEPKAS